MKPIITLAVATFAALVAAQQGPTYVNGTFLCPDPDGSYCAASNIIIRCNNGTGEAGNCNDNLAGEPPTDVFFAECFSCGTNSSQSACSKQGIVYPGSGSGLGSTPFSANDTSVCAASPPTPYGSNTTTTSSAPFNNGTSTSITASASNTSFVTTSASTTPVFISTNPGGPVILASSTPTQSASQSSASSAPNSSSSGAPAYTGAASGSVYSGAGAVVGFVAVLAGFAGL
ncbi:hypothetical protein BAUCODRAFT_476276 [Baudoinia panamericana UAMH 10762]|uniref:Carbohydrate-binding module family 52 protein n=1 Tax=Baudoinia panamericana (strain UAMH 10762) TaxID=717646 RepID=M2NC73_BAUPA|nr:uncharacterized protein BAUCODRAFT_476276 [Baudoinia panamericana UAMH 10762]EMC96480.1 hypothetical protein BAUCODRAFT_476276 [Baudoinia panamericana UAMH 10762]